MIQSKIMLLAMAQTILNSEVGMRPSTSSGEAKSEKKEDKKSRRWEGERRNEM